MLRRNVKNPHLTHIVVKLSLPESRKISLGGFSRTVITTFSTTRRRIPAVNARLRRFLVALSKWWMILPLICPSMLFVIVVGDLVISDSITIAKWIVLLLCALSVKRLLEVIITTPGAAVRTALVFFLKAHVQIVLFFLFS